jgi:hypothetical protein
VLLTLGATGVGTSTHDAQVPKAPNAHDLRISSPVRRAHAEQTAVREESGFSGLALTLELLK